MNNEFCKKKLARTILLIFIFSCISAYIAHNPSIVFGSGNATHTDGAALTADDVPLLSGALAPLIAMSSSPFIALTMVSGVGTFLNSGTIDPSTIPFANVVMSLPISHMGIFLALLAITAIQYFMCLMSASKILCDATLGKLENYVGTILAAGGTFVLTSTTTVYAATVTPTITDGNSGLAYILTTIIAFIVSALAYVVYFVMKTMIRALDILTLLASPIPSATALFTNIKYIFVSIFAWNALSNPFVTSIFGILILIVAFLVFRAAKRIELYYRRIYLAPRLSALLSVLFGRGYFVSVLPNKIPRSIAKEFENISVCLEGFFMNRTTPFYKREICYFVRSNDVNYLFKKRLFGKKIKIELLDDTYIEKSTALFKQISLYTRIFTDERKHLDQRKIHLVLRREHSQIIDKLVADANLINYNLILEERERLKAEERARKMQEMKEAAKDKVADAGNKIKGAFGGLFSGKNKPEQGES